MRLRVAALIALSGMAAIPAVSDALQAGSTTVHPSVRPRAGAGRTHFEVSFRAAMSTGGSFHASYRVTAVGPSRARCQSNAAVVAPATKAGSRVRVVLAPGGSRRWCAGTFQGQVWEQIVEFCPVGKACPAIQAPPLRVGKFTFHVTRG